MIAEGLSYEDACKLIDDLDKQGIYGCQTVGGVNIKTTKDNESVALSICAKYEAYINYDEVSSLDGCILLASADKRGFKIDLPVDIGDIKDE